MRKTWRSGQLATFGVVLVAAVVVIMVIPDLLAGPPRRSTVAVGSAGPRADAAQSTTESADAPAPAEFDRTAHSTTDPDSIWVVVNKTHPVTPAEFRPDLAIVRGYQVATKVAGPLERLLAAGDRRGLGFKIASAFRSFDYQQHVHGQVVAARGAAAADRVSARAGHSEHQTGLAVDLVTPADPTCDLDPCFARTPGGRWLARHAWRFGFVVRYQPGTTAITGYAPEPWHLRYVGRPLAAELRATGISTLEEFFGVPGGDYPVP